MKKNAKAAAALAIALAASSCASAGGASPGRMDGAEGASPSSPSRASAGEGPAGPYTAEQAARGEAVFAGSCTRCHEASDFSGTSFIPWMRAPLSLLAEYVRGNMPRGRPGSLSREEYTEIVAYMLALNEIPPGSAELPSDLASLRQIRVAAPGP